ncbi:uncharacterized protein LOC116788371 [Chiroxiphia lanceolata]|uniref:uncharacterized protein LOC116788371 n=1 Tax=Chiroxiphia lanceolata TaxID=296741 RepID=UPI0013CEFA7E|nr:uncharacterized protein LOC116788371 [Chiroxiphia lanceolata]
MKTTYLVFGTKGGWLISPVLLFLCCLFVNSLLRCTQITAPSSSECNNLLKLFVHRTVHKPWDETEVLFVCSGKLFMSREASESSKIQLPQILFFLLQRNVTARCFTHNLEKVCLHSQMKSCQVPVHYHRMKKLSRQKNNWLFLTFTWCDWDNMEMATPVCWVVKHEDTSLPLTSKTGRRACSWSWSYQKGSVIQQLAGVGSGGRPLNMKGACST